MKGKIFNAQEVQAILNKSKVMFREVIKPQPNSNINPVKLDYLQRTWQWATKESRRECPYQVGQKIFCKESFFAAGDKVIYKADYESYKPISPWKRSMKQEHSRISLLIKETRVERLASISEEDAKAEGHYLDRCECLPRKKDKSPIDACFSQHFCHIHGEEFKRAWNTTHKKPEKKLEADPWVWVVSFEVINN